MSAVFATLAKVLAAEPAVALVTVVGARGSTPREAGARMVVTAAGAISGTIGGGRLELEAVDAARALASAGRDTAILRRFALGPALGQCCGGHVTLAIEAITAAHRPEIEALSAGEAAGGLVTAARFTEGQGVRRAIVGHGPASPTARLADDGTLHEVFGERRRPVYLFGAGHVGRAVVLALAPLPFRVLWVDERADMFPAAMPRTAEPVVTDRPEVVAAAMEEGAFALVMTHDHGVDLAIMHAALRARRHAFLGLIGSATKRARFESRLQALGLPAAEARAFRCPIGVSGITSKEPALIAAAVAAELLIEDEAVRARRHPGEPLIQAVP
ncbi:xanthine dehydrogenase accessory protein XdhC [Chthonobacter rhizosphaerae]|uniref:xanthine dehydrogenase accessory protein XdhC n=1 Tax=Chthonobacter rhizosphaerae TaxID=2735553 RepID=UPI0015EF1A25